MKTVQGKSMAAFLAALLVVTQTAAAYEYPLHSETIREAYALGERNNQQTIDCLLQYIHRVTTTQKGRYIIAAINIATPFEQIVARGRRNVPGDSEVQTETELRTHPLNFIVRISVEWNSTREYTESAVLPDFSRDLSVQVTQGKEILPLHINHQLSWDIHDLPVESIELQFDPAKINSAPLHISVRTVDGDAAEAEFDLAKIR